MIITYDDPFIHAGSGIVPVVAHTFLTAAVPYTGVKVIELPVFRPNDYFFKSKYLFLLIHHTKSISVI